MAEIMSTFEILCLFATVLSSLCSALNLLLIWDMKVWNGHIALITMMTVYQLMYDVSFYYNNIAEQTSVQFKISLVLQSWGGIAQSITSNQIAFALLYIILKKKSFRILERFGMFTLCANILVLIPLIPYFLYLDNNDALLIDFAFYSYFAIRTASIVVIFFIYISTVILVRRIQKSSLKIRYEEEIAITLLASRLKYYPLIQMISRSAYTWYELQFGFTFNPAQETTNQYIAQCLVALVTPSGAIGYFLVFLYMQPYAWKYFLSRLRNFSRYEKPTSVASPSDFTKRNSDFFNLEDSELFDILRYDSFGQGALSFYDSDDASGPSRSTFLSYVSRKSFSWKSSTSQAAGNRNSNINNNNDSTCSRPSSFSLRDGLEGMELRDTEAPQRNTSINPQTTIITNMSVVVENPIITATM